MRPSANTTPPAQLVNVAEASLRPLPTVRGFLQRVPRVSEFDTALVLGPFLVAPNLSARTEKNQRTAFVAALDFARVSEKETLSSRVLANGCVRFQMDDGRQPVLLST